MEPQETRTKVTNRIRHMVKSAMIKNRRYLEDEQLIQSEQLDVFDEIFNTSVRDTEIKELSSHFAPIFRDDHPCHLAIWGKTGTGKTLTLMYFLKLLTEMCHTSKVPIRHVHLDLSNPRPCFRALNDLACLLNASKRYEKGISLEEMMFHIEKRLSRYHGYLVLFIDEVDNVRHDKDNFMTFLVRRLPQQVPAKVILVLVSNRLDWPDQLDPRVKSFLRMNELVFEPYDAMDLQHILRIRVEKALDPGAVEPGVIEKIAALASREHGDARKAVQLPAKSAYWAEKAGTKLTTDVIDHAADALETDRYLTLIRTGPTQMKAVMAAVIEAKRQLKKRVLDTGEAYEAYKVFCGLADIRSLTGRAFGDVLAELDLYGLLRCRIVSRGRYGRSREILLDLPEELVEHIYRAILSDLEIRESHRSPHS
jgi:archaeal cell division control protein 6